MVENLPANAGDMGSSPGLGRTHVPQSSWAREPQLLSLCVWSLCSATREAVIVRGPRTAMESGPRLPQLEKVLAQKRRPNTAINKLKKKKNQCLGLGCWDLGVETLALAQQVNEDECPSQICHSGMNGMLWRKANSKKAEWLYLAHDWILSSCN